MAVYLLLEIIQYQFDLLILPIMRTIVDLPERIGNWFTDPARWPVLFEVLGVAILAAIIAGMIWRRVGRSGPGGGLAAA